MMIIALFPNTRQAIKAEQTCQTNGIPTQIRPVPESISSQCGLCISIQEEEAVVVEKLFQEHQIQVTWHPWTI